MGNVFHSPPLSGYRLSIFYRLLTPYTGCSVPLDLVLNNPPRQIFLFLSFLSALVGRAVITVPVNELGIVRVKIRVADGCVSVDGYDPAIVPA